LSHQHLLPDPLPHARRRGGAGCGGRRAHRPRYLSHRGRAAARCRARRHGDQRRHGAGEGCQAKSRELAEAIAGELRKDALVEKVEVAGPGFINLTLKPPAWTDALRVVIEAGADYGRSDIGRAEPVNVEYVSANPTGPMHVGHGRGAEPAPAKAGGDVLANLLAFAGFKVTREYYINDAGAQSLPP
jgi:arginyl-tRNA synthetase